MDLGDEEGGELPAKRPNSSHLEEAEYAMGTLAGEPRANAHANYMELHKEGVARRAEGVSGPDKPEDMFGYFNSLK